MEEHHLNEGLHRRACCPRALRNASRYTGDFALDPSSTELDIVVANIRIFRLPRE